RNGSELGYKEAIPVQIRPLSLLPELFTSSASATVSKQHPLLKLGEGKVKVRLGNSPTGLCFGSGSFDCIMNQS
ncbi:hypothetical protein, partial [Paenibacillus sp. 453mf]|uniref:hypothetical protein n=1 Tax=Paenibacillus sp. 453mf TaxID=1761874 RepID=UPI0008ECBBAC